VITAMPQSFTERRLFSRRRALQALAAIPLTLPLARMLRAAGTGVSPKRLVLLMQNNGTQQANFWPDANMSSPIIDSLFQDPKTGQDNGLKAKTNLIKGVYIPFDLNDNYGNTHDMGFARMFTGERLLPSGDQPWGGGISVDQTLANAWGLDSLTLAVLASEVQPFPKPGFDHRVSFSYLGPGTVKQPRVDPLDVYQHLFPTPGTQDAAQRLRLRQSVLDGVTANLSEVSVRLGPAERAKLDYHLTAIRDVERQLGKSASVCISQPRPPQDYRAIDPNAEVSVDDYIPALVNDMIDLAVVSLKCGLTRIATIQFGYGGGKWKFAWKGINMNCHEEVAHLDTSDEGSTPENTQRVVLMNQYYASCVSRLAVQLDAVTEDGGTLLDNSLVVWANEQGRGDHSQENVPIVLIGKAGGSIPQGGRVIDGGPQVFNRVGCTILNVMGHPAAGFGDVPDCGVFEGLS
jgi:Protein of unknown function (DUF1552)